MQIRSSWDVFKERWTSTLSTSHQAPSKSGGPCIHDLAWYKWVFLFSQLMRCFFLVLWVCRGVQIGMCSAFMSFYSWYLQFKISYMRFEIYSTILKRCRVGTLKLDKGMACTIYFLGFLIFLSDLGLCFIIWHCRNWVRTRQF